MLLRGTACAVLHVIAVRFGGTGQKNLGGACLREEEGPRQEIPDATAPFWLRLERSRTVMVERSTASFSSAHESCSPSDGDGMEECLAIKRWEADVPDLNRPRMAIVKMHRACIRSKFLCMRGNQRNGRSIAMYPQTSCKVSRVFDELLKTLAHHTCVTRRPQGVAFLRATKELYGLAEVAYACVNIPIPQGARRYSHCVYDSAFMGQWVGPQAIDAEHEIAAVAEGSDRTEHPAYRARLILRLRQHVGETAFFGVTASANTIANADALQRQVRVLGSHFHEHILRLNGHQCERQLLLSARELDCLKWTAEGKTAWEASVILGITERTVRFHLNAAREKLQCTTTAQAVAKAVRDHMIDL